MANYKSGKFCAVAWCNSCRTNSTLSFFRFPKDPDRCREWLSFSKRDDLALKSPQELYDRHRICSKHFDQTQFCAGHAKRNLRPDACPHIIDEPSSVKKSRTSKKVVEKSFLSNKFPNKRTAAMILKECGWKTNIEEADEDQAEGILKAALDAEDPGYQNIDIYNMGSVLSLKTSHLSAAPEMKSQQHPKSNSSISIVPLPSHQSASKPNMSLQSDKLSVSTSEVRSNVTTVNFSNLKGEHLDTECLSALNNFSHVDIIQKPEEAGNSSLSQAGKKPVELHLPQHIMNALSGPNNSKCIVLSSSVAHSLGIVGNNNLPNVFTSNTPKPNKKHSDSQGKKFSQPYEDKPFVQNLSSDHSLSSSGSLSISIVQSPDITITPKEGYGKEVPEITVSINPTDIFPEEADKDSDMEYEEILGI